MSIESRNRDRRLLGLALGLLGASAVLGAALGASRLGLFVPPATEGSLGDATAILANNAKIWAVLAAAVLLQPQGVPGLAQGFLPLWLTDLTVALIVVFNMVALGGVLGALGLHALARVIVHAPFELGGFLLILVAYLRARRGNLQRPEALWRFALAGALLLCGAFLESYVSGAIA